MAYLTDSGIMVLEDDDETSGVILSATRGEVSDAALFEQVAWEELRTVAPLALAVAVLVARADDQGQERP